MALTKDDAEAIAERIKGTTFNIYQTAEECGLGKVGDEVFDQMEAQGLFKCDDCDKWQSTEYRDGERMFDKGCGVCQECVALGEEESI